MEDSFNCFYDISAFAPDERWWFSYFRKYGMDWIRNGQSKIANFRDYFDHNYTNFCQVMGLEPAVEHADPKLNYIETRKIVKALNLVAERSDVCWSL